MPSSTDKTDERGFHGGRLSEQAGVATFTPRSIVLGVVMCLIIGMAGPYWTFYLHSSTLFLDYSVGGAVFLLFVLVLVFNGCLRLCWRSAALSPGEMVVVTAMMLVSGAITTMGLVGYLVPNITAPYYLANPTNQWAEKLWPHLPRWTAPLDKDGGTGPIMLFYDGLEQQPDIWAGSWSPAGLWRTLGNLVRVTRAMPWHAWFRPLMLWAVFLGALYGCMISLMTIIRKQWVENERLSFPIAQVPQELCVSAADPWGPSSIFRRKALWAGFAIPFVLGSLTALHKFYAFVPEVPVVVRLEEIGPLPLRLRLSWAVLGFTFLIPNHVAFSIWSLNLAAFAVRSWQRSLGLTMQENLGGYGAARHPVMAHMCTGAMIVFVFSSLYFARRHLKKVLLCAVGRGPEGYGRREPSSYRTAVLVFVLSFLVMTVWLVQAGLTLFYALAFLMAAMLIFYGLARVVAQCGLAVTIAPLIPPVFTISTFGGGNFSTTGVVALTQAWSWCSDIRTSVMSSAIHGMYLARKKARGLLWTLLLSALVTFVVGTLFTVWLGYRHGAANLAGWFFVGGPKMTFGWGLREISASHGPNFPGHFWTVVGGLLMAGLTMGHRLFFWWPIHPVGLIISAVGWTDQLWFTIFLAWLIKGIITRVGGNRVLRTARGFFLGMILGQFTVAGLWAIFDTLTGTIDHRIFWI